MKGSMVLIFECNSYKIWSSLIYHYAYNILRDFKIHCIFHNIDGDNERNLHHLPSRAFAKAFMISLLSFICKGWYDILLINSNQAGYFQDSYDKKGWQFHNKDE